MFLAFCSDEDFWDLSDDIFFAGLWCFVERNRHIRESRKNDRVLDFPWPDSESLNRDYERCAEIYERVLSALTAELNRVNGFDGDELYYRIILGNWLISYVHNMYSRYVCLKEIFCFEPDIRCIGLDERCFITPFCTNEYLSVYTGDKYSMQLFSGVMKAMGKSFETKELEDPLIQKTEMTVSPGLMAEKAFSVISKAFSRVRRSFFGRNGVSLSMNLSLRQRLEILWRGRGIFDFPVVSREIKVSATLDKSLRDSLEFDRNCSGVEKVIRSRLFKDIPLLFLEAFHDFREKALSQGWQNSGVFAMDNSIHSCAVLKFFLAENRANLKKYIMQHGGGYGFTKNGIHEDYECSVADKFFTWGWLDGVRSVKLSSAKLARNSHRFRGSLVPAGVLIPLTNQPRYTYAFKNTYISDRIDLFYYDEVAEMVNSLAPGILCVLRLYHKDYGRGFRHELEGRLKDRYDVSFENSSEIALKDSLAKCRIFAGTHLSTTFLEAMSLDIPSVISFNEEISTLRPGAEEIFRELADVGILHYSPGEAAEHINKVYEDVSSWWESKDVVSARAKFKDTFAYTSENWVREWCDVLGGGMPG